MKGFTVHWFVSVLKMGLDVGSTQVGCCVLTLNQRHQGGQAVTEQTTLVTCEACKRSAPYLAAVDAINQKIAERIL